MTRVGDLRIGDFIRASWLGEGWHKVLDVGSDWSGSGKAYLAIEGFGSLTIGKDEYVERR